MPFQSSLGRFRLALLAALGASSLTACSGSVLDGTDNTLGSQDAGSGGGSASGGQGGVGNDAGAGGAPNGGAPACINPKPVVPEGEFGGPSRGYIQCENGVVHRVAAQACWSKLGPPDAGVVVPPGPDGSVTFNCRTNADCTDAPHGYCVIDSSGDPWDGLVSTVCRYGCVQDSDCDAGSICRCGDPVGTCVQASCKTDADCDGAFCQEGYDSSSCSPSRVTYRCGPRCTSDADCAEPSGFGYTCTNGNCQENAVCGRPFLVEGRARLARAEGRDDWAVALCPDLAGLSAAARGALAAHYTEIGLMEHASVAAFARFSLQLLALGAPPGLVEQTTQALEDETRHARVCFGLASAYGSADVGPGPLALHGALAGGSLEETIRTAFLEACVGETLAAIEVTEAAARATDPVVARVLDRIAADETRHAALGFQFVEWALDQLTPVRRAALARELSAAVDEQIALGDPGFQGEIVDEAAQQAHGQLSAPVRAELRRVALREVVRPFVQTLLTGRMPARAA